MSTTVSVVNIKCGGCGNRIVESLEKMGARNVVVSPESQTVTFDGSNPKEVLKKLSSMGYPAPDSKNATSKIKKAQSYASCAIGRWG